MTTQSSLMVAARVSHSSLDGLRAVLSTMNQAPGQADPANSLVPFGRLENLHYARFVILDDQTLDDIRLYNLPRQDYPVYLAFLTDFDGDEEHFLSDLMQVAASGLRRLFAFCDDFDKTSDLREWMRDHRLPSAADYVNWRGRTVTQVREQFQLRQAIADYCRVNASALNGQSSEQIRAKVRAFAQTEGTLNLGIPPPPSFVSKIVNLAHLVGVGLLILLLLPLVALLVVFRIRPMEKTDPEFAPRPSWEHARELALIEDHELTNQFTAMGSLKPGLARLLVMRYVLWVINWTARHVYNKGRLARVRTIQFAHWIFLDGRKRVLFCSNYDGSLDSYMDDFINKVPFGLNIVFSNGIGYPSTRWLLADGASDEQKFKYYLRRHELPTDVWYDAHPDVTAIEMERNSRICEGLKADALSESDAREWVQLLLGDEWRQSQSIPMTSKA